MDIEDNAQKELEKPIIPSQKPSLINKLLILNEKRKFHNYILGAVILILLVLGIGFFVFNFTKKQASNNQQPTNSTVTQPRVEYKSKNLVLKRKTDNGLETIYSFPESGDKRIIRWNDFLFYGSQGYGEKVELLSHNLKTGETKIVYEEETRRRYISDLKAIDNTLFFSVGGYLAGGATYWINLPPTGKPQKLTDSANGKIEFMNNRYWLISGEGDGCWGSTTYSLLNINTKRITPIATSNVGCIEGEEYIGIDKRDRMLFSFHTQDFSGTQEQDSTGIYKNIVAVPLTNPTAKVEVISKQTMPTGINEIRYSEEQDKLLLFGNVVYVYDFTANKLDKVLDVPKEWANAAIQSWKNNVVCLTQSENKKNIGVDLSTKQISDNSSCAINPSPSPKPYNEIEDAQNQELIKKLDLPSNYEFVLEEVS